MAEARRKFWGWGLESETLSEVDAGRIARRVGALTGLSPGPYTAPPAIDELDLPRPRVAPLGALAALCHSDAYCRASHTYGKSYPDYVRAWARDFSVAPDIVAYPEDEADVAALLDWAGDAGLAVIPYGAGSTVVGGVEPNVGDAYAGVLTIDLDRLDKVLEIDRASRAARIQGGALGPAPGTEIEQWRAIKGAASDALIRAGGTITHHHSVGRDHMPWYEAQRPALFGEALAAAKRALDPNEILNPGVLLPPWGAAAGEGG